jgi:hypothetical protein
MLYSILIAIKMNRYSRRASIEEKKNIKNAYFYVVLSIIAIGFLIFLGLPTLVKFAGFLGDLGKSNKPVDITDITPPAPPQFDSMPEYTNNEKLEIAGTSENGAVVTITANGDSSEVVANSDGRFSFLFNLDKGDNTIEAKAKDTAGNESTKTKLIKIIFDNTEPSLENLGPTDGASFYGSGQRQLVIKGNTNEKVNLLINEKVVSVKDDGTFSYATTLSEGVNSFEVKAIDMAGNETKESFTVNFTP